MDNMNSDIVTNYGIFSSLKDVYLYMEENNINKIDLTMNYWGTSLKFCNSTKKEIQKALKEYFN